MILKKSAKDRHLEKAGWLESYWLFSFSEYYDPENINHGALRVFNDDIIQPHHGFSDHPHQNYEIITIVREGELTHRDSAGNSGTLRPGDVQRMSAGTGIVHSEFNHGNDPIHLYQIWIRPEREGLAPSYMQRHFDLDAGNRLSLLVSPEGRDSLSVHSDAMLFHGSFDAGSEFAYSAETDRKIFLYLTDGEAGINGIRLNAGDQARVEGESRLLIRAFESSRFVLIDTSNIDV